MRYFKKLINIPIVILPGRGRVYDTDLLVGDEFAQFVPMFLYECDANGWPLPAKPQPTPEEVARMVPPPPPARVPLDAPTHVPAPARPPVPPALAQAWEERRQQISTPAGLNSLADALALAEKQTIPLEPPPPEPPPEAPPAEAAPAVAESPKPEIPTTMAPEVPPKRKRGRPRKHPLPQPPEPPKEEGK